MAQEAHSGVAESSIEVRARRAREDGGSAPEHVSFKKGTAGCDVKKIVRFFSALWSAFSLMICRPS